MAEVADLMARIEDEKATMVQPKADAVAADEAAAKAQVCRQTRTESAIELHCVVPPLPRQARGPLLASQP